MHWCCLRSYIFYASILFIPFLVIWYFYRLKRVGNRICVVVLGDIGRSPRMQYHSLSCAKSGFDVDIVAFGGSNPSEELLQNDRIHVYQMSEPPKQPKVLPRLLFYIFKTVYQSLQLLVVLFLKTSKSGYILVQNPPAIPSLAVLWLVSFISGSKLIIDWHNYGYTILSLNLKNQKHPLVRFSKWYEGFFGKMSSHNFCVTKAMKDNLWMQWRIRSTVLYDRSASHFHKTELGQQHQLFLKLSKDYPVFYSETSSDSEVISSTRFTQQMDDGSVQERADRPCLLVSSTSWTEDEDFSILLKALKDYELSLQESKVTDLPDILCVITGKGPLKEYYKNLISKIDFKHVSICTPWLEASDYPRLLGSANLGICLHTSSSGLDLPMKVVDMFGSGLPVCAINFNCLDELVQHDINGYVFNSSEELSQQLKDLLAGFPNNQKKLTEFRNNLSSSWTTSWDDNWKETVLPVLKNM